MLSPLHAASPFYVTLPGGAAANQQAAWSAEAAAFGASFDITYEVTTMFQYDPNEITVDFGGAPRCTPLAEWGFCRTLDSPYETYQVQPEQVLDPATIRRVLAYRFLGPNPLPGLMSLQAPADQLSTFEAQTIRMILQRPLPNRWPDSDR